MGRQRILYVITKGEGGGAQRYVTDLARNLDARNFETIVLAGGRDLRWLSNTTRPWLLFLNDWLAFFELVRAFHRIQPNIIHLNSSKAGVIGSCAAGAYALLARLSGHPKPNVVFTAHGWVFNPTNYYAAPIRLLYAFLHKFAGLFVDVIINVSDYDRNLAVQHRIAPSQKLTTIWNGFDTNTQFLAKKTARLKIKQRLKKSHRLHPQYLWIGSLGRMTKEKDYEAFIEASRALQNTYCFIIGDGKEKEYLESLIIDYNLRDTFFIIPPSGNDAQFLKAFDVFVLPSIKEGLPYTLLEAMAAEIPTIGTDVGGIPEIIVHEQNGLLVPSRNTDALKNAILRYTSNAALRATLGAAGSRTVRTQFTLRDMLKKTERVYTSFSEVSAKEDP